MHQDEVPMSDQQERKIVLENLSFKISHGIKGPIATMLGILELIRINAIRADEMPGICLHFKGCVDELNKNVRELASIVHHQENSR